MAARRKTVRVDEDLPPRWALFCTEYGRDFNGKAAAERAGFAEASAKQSACRLLADRRIQARLSRDLRQRMATVEISVERVIAELARIAFADIGDFISIDADGNAVVDLRKVPPGGFAPVVEITQDVYMEGRGDGARAVRRTRFKLHDKLTALTKLGQYLRLFSERGEAPVADEPAASTAASDLEVARRIAFVLAKAAREQTVNQPLLSEPHGNETAGCEPMPRPKPLTLSSPAASDASKAAKRPTEKRPTAKRPIIARRKPAP